MGMMLRKMPQLALSLAFALCANAASAAEQRFITIGTGGVTGVYYSVGGAICQLVNKNRRTHGLRCSVEATPASVYNINALRKDDLDLALAQSGIHYNAWHGIDAFKSAGPYKELRSLFSLHFELVTVVARKNLNVAKFEDFRGKRLNVGVVGAGTRVGAEILIDAMSMKASDFAQLAELKPDEQVKALCANKIDGFVYMIGHPAQNITEATSNCDSALVPLTGPKIEQLLRTHPYYVAGVIPGGLYRGNAKPVPTYGPRATLLAPTNTSADIVYQTVKAVFDNFDEFRALHPALAELDPKTMITNGLTAPLHEGALRYYKERGWL